MDDCVFCRIIKGDLPCRKVYEDEKVLVFEDLHPVAPVHVLIIPKEHIGSVMDLNVKNAQVLADMHLAAKNIAGKTGLDKEGFRLINNCGEGAGQTVNHLHYHMLGGRKLGAKIL